MNDLIRMKSNCLGAVIRRLGFAFIPPASWEHSGLHFARGDCAITWRSL